MSRVQRGADPRELGTCIVHAASATRNLASDLGEVNGERERYYLN